MIKNLIFDFGDVFINLNKDATFTELQKLGISKISEEMLVVAKQYEVGAISTNQFVAYFKDQFCVSSDDLIKAWNAILLDFPLYRLSFLKKIKASGKYRIFLLSNTNDLHISWIKNHWGIELYNEFKSCFEKFYLSHEIALRKPNVDTYRYVLKENNLLVEESFFIDDTKENTIVAEELGIKTWNLIPQKEDVIELLTRKEFNR